MPAVPTGVVGALGISPQPIFPSSNSLKMIGIDARMDSAEMVNFKPFRDLSDGSLVGPAVSADLPVVGKVEIPIAVLVESPRPEPAGASLVDLLPEAICGWTGSHSKRFDDQGIAESVPSVVMRLAPASNYGMTVASFDRAGRFEFRVPDPQRRVDNGLMPPPAHVVSLTPSTRLHGPLAAFNGAAYTHPCNVAERRCVT